MYYPDAHRQVVVNRNVQIPMFQIVRVCFLFVDTPVLIHYLLSLPDWHLPWGLPNKPNQYLEAVLLCHSFQWQLRFDVYVKR